ncbi:ATP synthase complex subunit H-domain-containing protein [Sporodiniella umbellata]|nr:ATP synthase complex subunit H-domain-containing protein [Sporodiniella umbellata]
MSIARNAVRFIAVKPARVPSMAARSFSAAAVMKKDVLQDLFLKELKAYKPQPVAATEEGAAKEFKMPAAPAVPEIDADVSQQLAAYDAEVKEAAH